MNLEKMTVKSREALAAAQRLATERNHQQVEPAHLLAALLAQDEGVVWPLLHKIGADPRGLLVSLNNSFSDRPQVYGGQVYLSEASATVLESAAAEAEALGDLYLSTEHILLALVEVKDETGDL